ncbi:DUF2489 domain-containing protein [Burkholderia sp. Ax-1719]|uniref:DUF2489 domain-containing protein n=1 Tax=Burkholderia sp. Ax-1719 TaxID=2608334 RepID=UPI00141E525E|nr:DUF2489 domain-containing protein [Burkholderia sp. Ax-1719]NIE63201.1 DUF2489 domain-containing protein [Burkholderia sp. Ax-1719]
MKKHTPHEEYVRSVRQQAALVAQAMLDERLSFLIGSRQLAGLRYETDITDDDADFLIFVAIDSETDAFPLGSVREHWDPLALAKLEPKIKEAELWASSVGADACRSLIARFAE